MAYKGSPKGRTSHSSAAFKGSGGLQGNTTLGKFNSNDKESELEKIISNSRTSINETLEARAKVALKYLHPSAYFGLLVAEFLYRHRERIYKTIDTVVDIWSEDSDTSEKIIETAGEIVKTSVDIAKKEVKDKVVEYVASKFSESVVNQLDDAGVIDGVSNEVLLRGHKERFKALLEDTIEKQTRKVIESVVGDE